MSTYQSPPPVLLLLEEPGVLVLVPVLVPECVVVVGWPLTAFTSLQAV